MRLLSLSQKAYCTATAILCSLIFNQLTAAAVIQRSNSTQLKGSGQECTSSPEWLGPKLVVDDCAGTVNKFYNIEVLRHGRQQYEFLGVNAEPEFKLPTMQTPRRYTVGKSPKTDHRSKCNNNKRSLGACTLVVVMMNVFKDGDLPDPPKGPFYDTEVTTYHDLHMAAVQVELHCVVLRRSGGYEALGEFLDPC